MTIVLPFSSKRIRKGNFMKKTFNQIFMVIGFVVMIAGILWTNIGTQGAALITFSESAIMAVFAVACVFATNPVVKIIGNGLASLVGAYGIGMTVWMDPRQLHVGSIITCIGMILMGVAVLLYGFGAIIKMFGFVRSTQPQEQKVEINAFEELAYYMELQQDKIITEEEFITLKLGALERTSNTTLSMDDLKKWKELLDRQIITEAEFAKIKKESFFK